MEPLAPCKAIANLFNLNPHPIIKYWWFFLMGYYDVIYDIGIIVRITVGN